MRGGAPRSAGGGRGMGRNRSPVPSNVRDHRSGPGHRGNNPFRPRRLSLSPPPADRLGGRQRSPERRREGGFAARQQEHGKHKTASYPVEGIDYQHKYMLPDHPTDLNDVHALLKSSLKPSRTGGITDMAGPSALIGSQGASVQESLFLDDGPKRALYTLPHGSGSIANASSLSSGIPRTDLPLRDSYGDKEREKFYTRDVSFSATPSSSQARPLAATSSSVFSKNPDLFRTYVNRGAADKFSDDPLGYTGYTQSRPYDRVRRSSLSPPIREPPEYHYNDPGQRRRDDHGYLPSDGPYQKMVYGPPGEYRDPDGFLDPAGRRGTDPYYKNIRERSLWDGHHFVQGDAPLKYHDLKEVHEDYADSSHGGFDRFALKTAEDHEIPAFQENYRVRRNVVPMPYRERPESPTFNTLRHVLSPKRDRSRVSVDFDTYNQSPEAMLRRNYVISADMNGRNVHNRIRSPIDDDEMWSYEEDDMFVEERRHFFPPRRLAPGRPQENAPSRKLYRNHHVKHLSSDSSLRVEGGQRTSLKKRLRPVPLDFHDTLASERRQEVYRPHKVWKRVQGDRYDNLKSPEADIQIDAHRLNKDPPEDSEEFKQQVHKAFLLFSKLLNETPHQQKRFQENKTNPSKLLCCVCGSLNSKEFADIHCLLSHSYHSRKAGLQTDHLGFHKALCVLNGWNWLVVPDASQAYKRTIPSELKALKEDLILWPPVFIIHNSSIGNKSKSNGSRVVSTQSLQEILKEMGFGSGKIQVCRGKPANQSVLLVKFMPTLTGLQEAERLSKYYTDNKRGRLEFQHISSNDDGSSKTTVEKDADLLYGYMAVAGDLDKLDPETKKRSLVKSKKEIEAIADAPLKID